MKHAINRRSAMELTAGTALAALAGAAFAQDKPAPATQPGAAPGLLLEGTFKDGLYVLPKLPYDYDALESADPASGCDARTLKIHHTKHHAAYVTGLNQAMEKLDEARKAKDFASITALSRAVAFHGSGHFLHSLFWHSMAPGGTKMPASLAKAVDDNFGSFDVMAAQFAAAATKVEGGGWGLLVYEPLADRLLILQAEKHENLAFWGAVPLLVCDVWEHAYYLKYANDRPAWVQAFLKLANWEFAAARYAAAKKV